MGSCVSVRKNPESVMKVKVCFGGTKSDNFVVPSSPSEDNLKSKQIAATDANDDDDAVAHVVGLKSFPADFGSKDETFFDSKAWLDSDCDDDFYSVNGDFTPSQGSTPMHYKHSPGIAQISKPVSGNKTYDQESEPSPTPSEKRKRLSELFQENARDDLQNDDHQTEAKTGTNTPFLEATPNGVSKPEINSNNKNKMFQSVQCCLPRLVLIRRP